VDDPGVTDLGAMPRKSTADKPKKDGRWSLEEHALFIKGVSIHGRSWSKVAQVVGTRTTVQVRSHAQKYELKMGAKVTATTENGSDAATPKLPPPGPAVASASTEQPQEMPLITSIAAHPTENPNPPHPPPFLQYPLDAEAFSTETERKPKDMPQFFSDPDLRSPSLVCTAPGAPAAFPDIFLSGALNAAPLPDTDEYGREGALWDLEPRFDRGSGLSIDLVEELDLPGFSSSQELGEASASATSNQCILPEFLGELGSDGDGDSGRMSISHPGEPQVGTREQPGADESPHLSSS